MRATPRSLSLCLVLPLALACKSHKEEPPAGHVRPPRKPPAVEKPRIGLVLGLGGRGDQSFNDSALRGLEFWGAGLKYEQALTAGVARGAPGLARARAGPA